MARLGHHFCPHCKSWLFTRFEGMSFVNVRPTMMDERGTGDAAWTTPFVETYVSEKLDWVSTPARHSFAQFPPMEAYEGLIGEYQALVAGG